MFSLARKLLFLIKAVTFVRRGGGERGLPAAREDGPGGARAWGDRNCLRNLFCRGTLLLELVGRGSLSLVDCGKRRMAGQGMTCESGLVD